MTAMAMVQASAPKRHLLHSSLERELGLALPLLQEQDVEDIALNPDSRLWVKRTGKAWERCGTMTAHNALSLISVVAAMRDQIVNSDSPVLETVLPHYGARFQGLVPPTVAAACFCIRKTCRQIFSMEQYIADGILTERQCTVLREAVLRRDNIIIAGGTGTGKTTFLDMLLRELFKLCPDDRVITIEEIPELQCSSPNLLAMFVNEATSALQLLKASLRVRPTRIIVGEVRGAEAFTMLKAMDTGHPGGLATVHATTAAGALSRLELLSAEGSDSKRIREIVAAAVNVVVGIVTEHDFKRYPAGRRVQNIITVTGLKDGQFLTEEATPYLEKP